MAKHIDINPWKAVSGYNWYMLMTETKC